MEKCAADIGSDRGVHTIEHLESFIGVGLKRIGLSVGTEPDSVTELGHLVDMFCPSAVDTIERDGLFGKVSHLLSPVFSMVFVKSLELGTEKFLGIFIGETIQRRKIDFVFFQGENLFTGSLQFLCIHDLFLIFDIERLIADLFGTEHEVIRNRFGNGLAEKNMVSSFVHDLSLTRENIIVVEKLFTSIEVLSFDSLLSGSDGLHHHSGFKGFIS